MYVKFYDLEKPNKKKMKAVLYDDDDKNKKKITFRFGSMGSSDFTINKDDLKKENYIKRHSVNEDWTKINAGSLSRFVLWNLKNKEDAIKDYIKRFKLNKKLSTYNDKLIF